MTRLKIAFFIFRLVHKILLYDFYYLNLTYKNNRIFKNQKPQALEEEK